MGAAGGGSGGLDSGGKSKCGLGRSLTNVYGAFLLRNGLLEYDCEGKEANIGMERGAMVWHSYACLCGLRLGSSVQVVSL